MEESRMFPEVLNHEQFMVLRSACAKACVELGIDSEEIGGERLAQIMVAIAEDGESNPDVIRARAVHQMQPSGSFFYRG
jgi:hypothetical protein